MGKLDDFESLPCDVLQYILSDVIDVVDIASLDTAYCCCSKQPLLLEVVSNLQINRCTRVWLRYEKFLTLDEMLCESLIKRMGMRIRHVDFQRDDSVLQRDDSVHDNTNMLHLIASYCKNLVKLCCESFSDLRCISDVLRECPALSELHVTGTFEYFNPFATNPKIVCCRNLALLNFEQVDVNEPVVHYILECAPNVRKLKIKVYKALYFNIPSLQNLQRLSIRGSSIRDQALIEITKRCSQIEHLDLSDCTNVTDEGIVVAMKNLQTLRSLSVEFISMSFSTLRELVRCHSTTLETFYAPFEIEEDHIDFLLRKCPVLHTLSLDIQLMNFEQIDGSLFHNVKKLILSGGMDSDVCDALEILAPHCQKLEFLGLVLYDEYDSNDCEELDSMVAHCTRLHTLVFVESRKNDDIVVASAATKSEWNALRPNLKIQYYMYCEVRDHPLVFDIYDL